MKLRLAEFKDGKESELFITIKIDIDDQDFTT